MIVEFVTKLNGEFKFETSENHKHEEGSFVLGNVAIEPSTDKIMISVIRIEEESTMKNIPNVKFVDNTYQKKNPQIYINYYLMFYNTYYSYKDSIKCISEIIRFFQKNKTLKFDDNIAIIDLFTPSFDQLNQIWSIHGGKHYPNVIYKVRVGAYEEDQGGTSTAPIKTITKTIGHDD